MTVVVVFADQIIVIGNLNKNIQRYRKFDAYVYLSFIFFPMKENTKIENAYTRCD